MSPFEMKFSQGKPCKFGSARCVLEMTLIMDRQLFAGENAEAGIGGKLMPERGGLIVFAATPGE